MAENTIPKTLINGVYHSWAQVEIKYIIPAGSFICRGVMEISYKNPLKPGEVRANGPRKQGRTMGEQAPEGSITLLRAHFAQMQRRMGNGWQVIPFNIEIDYEAQGLDMVHDVLLGCRLIDAEAGGAQGTDASKVVCPLDIMNVLLDGFDGIPGEDEMAS